VTIATDSPENFSARVGMVGDSPCRK
jgi:hypothetical protein